MNQPTSELINLSEFAALLSKAEDPRQFFSDIFTQARPYRLSIESDEDLLHLLLLLIPMRGLPSQRTTQMTLRQENMTEAQFHAACVQYLDEHLLFAPVYKENTKTKALELVKQAKDPKGSFPFDTIAYEESAAKIPMYLAKSLPEKLSSPLVFEFCSELGKVANLKSKDSSTAVQKILTEVLSSICSHPAKLMGIQFNGGYTRSATNEEAQNWNLVPWAVHEFDFDVASPEALSCAANYQAWSKVVLALIQYKGFLKPIHQILSDEQLRERLKALVVQHYPDPDGVERDKVLGIMSQAIDAFKIRPNPSKADLKQVFVGQFSSSRGSRVVNVAMPAATFHEFERVIKKQGEELKLILSDHVATYEAKWEEAQAELQAEKENLKLLKKEKPRNLAKEESLALRIERLKTVIPGLKKASESSAEAFIRLPAAKLEFGGANPQNIASGLSSRHHNVNLLVKIPTISSRRAEDISKRRAYYEQSLLARPRIRNSGDTLPWFLKETMTNAKAKTALREFAVTLALKSLTRIFELREIYETERDKAGSPLELAKRLDSVRLGLSPEVESLIFDAKLSYAQRKELAENLSAKVGEKVLEAVKLGFKQPVSQDKKIQMLAAIDALCLQELA